jgi:hypothetical protein
MGSMKDRLSTLNRQYREIEIKALDGDSQEIAFYRRPTEIEDDILRKAMSEEYDTILTGLKDGDNSVYATLLEMFAKSDVALSIDSLVSSQAQAIRQRAVKELGKPEPKEDTTDEDRKAYIDELVPIFERYAEDIREMLRKDPKDVVASKAAQARVESIASDRAFEIYRRRLIAQALFEKDEATDQFTRVFETQEQVPEFLDTDTINSITSKIMEEMNRVKNLPLK